MPVSRRLTRHPTSYFDASFGISAGTAMGIIGPSASGKSSLARALVGVWPLASGKICLDGAALKLWQPKILGNSIGYLPQEVQLFEGTIADNIAASLPMHPRRTSLLRQKLPACMR